MILKMGDSLEKNFLYFRDKNLLLLFLCLHPTYFLQKRMINIWQLYIKDNHLLSLSYICVIFDICLRYI